MLVSLNFFSCGYFGFIEFFVLSALTPCFVSASLNTTFHHYPSIHLEECVVTWGFWFVCVFIVCLLVINSLHFYWPECLILPSLLKDNSRLRVIFSKHFLLVSVSIEKAVIFPL